MTNVQNTPKQAFEYHIAKAIFQDYYLVPEQFAANIADGLTSPVNVKEAWMKELAETFNEGLQGVHNDTYIREALQGFEPCKSEAILVAANECYGTLTSILEEAYETALEEEESEQDYFA